MPPQPVGVDAAPHKNDNEHRRLDPKSRLTVGHGEMENVARILDQGGLSAAADVDHGIIFSKFRELVQGHRLLAHHPRVLK